MDQSQLRVYLCINTPSDADLPLHLLLQLMKGDAAVLDAEVHAVVTRPDGQRVRLKLLDNGLGGTISRLLLAPSAGRPAAPLRRLMDGWG